MPGFLINTPEQLDELLRTVAHPNLQAQFDLYHMARQGLDIPAGISLLAGRIGHVQFADCPGRGEPGTGTLDFASLLHSLRASEYVGWLGAEYKPSQATPLSLDWLPLWQTL
jgi:hydroxypyruvate isomerase